MVTVYDADMVQGNFTIISILIPGLPIIIGLIGWFVVPNINVTKADMQNAARVHHVTALTLPTETALN